MVGVQGYRRFVKTLQASIVTLECSRPCVWICFLLCLCLVPTNCFYLRFNVSSTELPWLPAWLRHSPCAPWQPTIFSFITMSLSKKTLLFFFKDSFTFIFICMRVLPPYVVCAPYACLVPKEAIEGHWFSWPWS